MIAREGYSVVFTVTAISVVLFVIGFWAGGIFSYILGALAILSFLFTLYFFREPKRTPPANADANLLIAPADGKVIQIIDVHDDKYLKGPCRQISIFLSPLDVHVNYVPIAGDIEYVKYYPGQYLVAWHEKASELNERSEFGVKHQNGTKILFRQITGYVARRIVYSLEEGQKVTAGQKFGMMKFGSRMDILVPANVKLQIREGDRTVAVESIMGVIE